MDWWWSWLLTGVGVTGLYFAGRKRALGWGIGIAAQVLWFTYAVATTQWGFIVSCLAYGAVYARNFVAWRREARAPATKVMIVPSIANLEAPTVAELTAGIDLGHLLAKPHFTAPPLVVDAEAAAKRRHALAFNAITHALADRDRWVPLDVREHAAAAVVTALAGEE